MSYLFECVSPRARRAKRKAKASSTSQLQPKISQNDVTKDAVTSDDDEAYVKTPEVTRAAKSDVNSSGRDVTETANDEKCHEEISGEKSDDVDTKITSVTSREASGDIKQTQEKILNGVTDTSHVATGLTENCDQDILKDSGVAAGSEEDPPHKVCVGVDPQTRPGFKSSRGLSTQSTAVMKETS